MKNEHLLDEQELGIRKDATLEMVAWWEKRRIIYNLVLLGIGILGIIFLYLSGSMDNDYAVEGFFTGAIFYGIAANICYTISWIIEIFIRHYLSYEIPQTLRGIVFGLGLGFSILFTLGWILLLNAVASSSFF